MVKDNQAARTFLVSPLEWGLGHATRLSALIDRLLALGHRVVIAADGLPWRFFAERYPNLPLERLPIRQIRYAKQKRGFFLYLLWQIPGFLYSVRQSRKKIHDLVSRYHPDFILADNRYGFHHPQVPSVFITHQLRPMPPKGWRWLHSLTGRLHLASLRAFDEIWVADFADEPVAGRLAQIPWKNNKIRYIGPLSWLTGFHAAPQPVPALPDILVLLSGPEPHRSLLEERLLHLLAPLSELRITLLRGQPQGTGQPAGSRKHGAVSIFDHLPGDQIAWLIRHTPKIICRAGVVTLYDLAVLQRPALMIPTSGQTEQEYVAQHWHERRMGHCLAEKDLSLDAVMAFDPQAYRVFPDHHSGYPDVALIQLLQRAQNPAGGGPGQPG